MERKGRYIQNILRLTRRHFAYRQKAAAQKMGVDPGDLSRWEKGSVIPSLGNAFKFQILYGKSPSELFAAYFHEIELEMERRSRDL